VASWAEAAGDAARNGAARRMVVKRADFLRRMLSMMGWPAEKGVSLGG
jgi:hypothetical protein